jgi:hypothetical protein
MEQKEMLINGALTAALCAWSLLSFDPRLRPIQIGTIAYLLTFLKKLHRLDPSPEGRDNPAKKTADNVRGACFLPPLSLPASVRACALTRRTTVRGGALRLLALHGWGTPAGAGSTSASPGR